MELYRTFALESLYSTHPRFLNPFAILELAVHALFGNYARRALSALCCAVAILAAGCHGHPSTSGYGIMWVTVTDEPGDFTSYIVTIDSVTLTRNDGAVVTMIGTPEVVNFAQLYNIAEMWGSGAVPVGTYVSATITLDYTNAFISVMRNGLPVQATLVDAVTGGIPTTYSVAVNFDPAHQPTITSTYASTSALRLAIDLNVAASSVVDATSTTPVVRVRPYLTASVLPADTKLIRVRGPLINSSIDVSTYTVYVRPFYDEANNIGSLSLFSQPNTIYTVNGSTYVGAPGLAALGVLSAGTTMTAGFTTFEPDYNQANQAYAGKFNLVYVIGASSLEDQYTEGLSGDVIARNGDTLTLLGSTLFLNTANVYQYLLPTTQVLLGPGTIVTADDNTTLKGLSYRSIGVGQHISARGIYSVSASNVTTLDATGTSSTNTGSVRLQSTELWGSLVSSATGSVVMNLQTINNWPVSDYNFAGNGATAGQNPTPAAYLVDSGAIPLPADTVAGDPLWVSGFSTPFGSAPPDWTAVAVNNELSVQTAGGQVGGALPTTPGTQICGVGSQVCDTASLEVIWTQTTGTTTPFSAVSDTEFSINLSNAAYVSGVIRIGSESIDLKSLAASPLVVPTTLPATLTFAPQFGYGNPKTSTTTSTSSLTTALVVFSNFPAFVTGLNGLLSATDPALQLEARGVFDRTTNTFTATSISFVL